MNNQGFHPEFIERGLITVVIGIQTDSAEHGPECTDIFRTFLNPTLVLCTRRKSTAVRPSSPSSETAAKRFSNQVVQFVFLNNII